MDAAKTHKRHLPCVVLVTGLIILLPRAATMAHPADTLWIRTLGGDIGYSVCQTADRGFAVTGGSRCNIYLVRTDTHGCPIWAKTFGGTTNGQGNSIAQTTDGGFIIAGCTALGPGPEAAFLLRTDENGDGLWLNTYGGSGSDGAYSVDLTTDGGYVICGFTGSFGAGDFDAYLVKTDASGDTIWTRTYGGDKGEDARSVQQTPDGGYIFAGKTKSFGRGGDDIYLVRTDVNGVPRWERTHGGVRDDAARSVRQIANGGFVVAGYSWSFRSDDIDGYVITTDSLGNRYWSTTSNWPDPDYFESVWPTRDGGYIMTGTMMFFGQLDLYLVKANERLEISWDQIYGITATYKDDIGRCVRQTVEGNYIICGNTFSYSASGSDVYLMETVDEVPPEQPVAFEATAEEGRVTLRWTNSLSPEAAGTHIRYATKTYPSKPSWGWPVPGSNDGHFDGLPGSDGTFTHTGLVNAKTYYYCAFAYDDAGNYSSPLRADARPVDVTPPHISVAVLRNPYPGNYVDIRLAVGEPIYPNSIEIWADETLLQAKCVDSLRWVWQGDFALPDSASTVVLTCSAADLVRNDTTLTAFFSSLRMESRLGGRAVSACGKLSLDVAPGALPRDCYMLILPCTSAGDGSDVLSSVATQGIHYLAPAGALTDTYAISPAWALSGRGGYLTWQYVPEMLPADISPEQIYIEHDLDGPLQCVVDPESRTISATVHRLGLFRLLTSSEHITSRLDPDFLDLMSCQPNPFIHSTTIVFSVKSRQRATLGTYDIRGRLLRTIINETVNPGSNQAIWDGTAGDGSRVAPGVYFARVAIAARTATRKLIVVGR